MDTYFPKHFHVTQIYAEPRVTFKSSLHRKKAREWLRVTDTNFVVDGLLASKYQGYELGFVITTSKSTKELKVMGPRKGRKNKFLEYALWIPYSPVVNAPKPLTKLTEYFKQGVAEVLRKLEYPEESIEKVLKNITDTPIT